MLDFYLIPSSTPSAKSPKSLEYIGGIDMDCYDRLIRKGYIDSKFDYFSDFRWSKEIIKQILERISGFESDTDTKQLRQILIKAQKGNLSLIAYCD